MPFVKNILIMKHVHHLGTEVEGNDLQYAEMHTYR